MTRNPSSQGFWSYSPAFLLTDTLRSKKSVRLREVTAYRRLKRLKMECLYVAENMTKCPLMRGVRLREVAVRGGSTVLEYKVAL